MSTVKTRAIQIGIDAVPSNNFTITVPETPDGTLRIFRGNTGALLAELLRIDADGKLSTPAGGEMASTGDFKYVQRAAPPPGWIVGDGSTIGSTVSGATRANNDTWPLFAAWWTDYGNATLPILTSAGAPSARGASAGADWNEGKRLTVFNMTDDRFPVGANGVGTINGTKYADQLQGFALTATAAISGNIGSPYNALAAGPNNGVETLDTRQFKTNAFVSDGVNGTPRIGPKTLPPRLGMLPCYKL